MLTWRSHHAFSLRSITSAMRAMPSEGFQSFGTGAKKSATWVLRILPFPLLAQQFFSGLLSLRIASKRLLAGRRFGMLQDLAHVCQYRLVHALTGLRPLIRTGFSGSSSGKNFS